MTEQRNLFGEEAKLDPCRHRVKGPEFDGAESLRLKAEGQLNALSSRVAATWQERAMRFVMEAIAGDRTFTADSLVEAVGLPRAVEVNRNNAVGAFISGLVRRHVIRRVGYTTATRTTSHGRVLAEWAREKEEGN